MDEIVAFIFPFLFVIVFGLCVKNKITLLQNILIIGTTCLLCLAIRAVMLRSSMTSTEYWGGYVEKISYYEPWDELVIRTREVCVGHDSEGNPKYETQTYTEREYHKESWTYLSSFNKREHSISKATYDMMKAKLNSQAVFRDMNRDYYRIDGDAYDTFWDHTISSCFDLTTTKRYQNRIKAAESHTIFRYSNISKAEANELGLKDYPEMEDFMAQNPIIGGTPSIYDINEIKYINAIHGAEHQFRMYMLIFDGYKYDVETAEIQKGYWQGGNKNEFIVCLGIIGDSVAWCSSFSWCDEPKLELMTKTYFIENPKLDIQKYGQWLDGNIALFWKRKQFTDFDYIKIGLTETQGIWLFILSLLFSVGISMACYKFSKWNKQGLL